MIKKLFALLSTVSVSLASQNHPDVTFYNPLPIINFVPDLFLDLYWKTLRPLAENHPLPFASARTKVIQDVGCPICKVGVAGTQVFNT